MTLFHIDSPAVADAGSEVEIQIALRKALKPTPCAFVAVPNGAQRSAWAAMKAKQEGLQTGFPDGMIIWPGGIAFVEIKARSGSLSEQQHIWLNFLTKAGFNAGVFRSVRSCMAWLSEQGAPVPVIGSAAA